MYKNLYFIYAVMLKYVGEDDEAGDAPTWA